MTPRGLLWILVISTGVARLGWGYVLGLGMDEAYHALFLRHPDWSYFDHPPMLALVEALGVTLAGGWVAPITLRFGFVLLFAGSTWLMARLTSRYFGPWAGLLAGFALNISAYHTAAAGGFVLPDGPLLFFWLLTLDRVTAALDRPERWAGWVQVGLAWGGAMLSKYHAVFLPAGVFLYAALEPSARHLLRRVGPYLAVGIGLILFTPVLVWNATHDWVSFLFQGQRAVGGLQFQPVALALAIGGQALYLFPWLWVLLVALLFGRVRDFYRGASVAERFLVCQSLVPLTVFTAVACVRPVLPHWTLVAYLSIFPLVGRYWETQWRANPARTRRRLAIFGAVPAGAMLLFVVQYQTGVLNRIGLPVQFDPTVDLYGWDQIIDRVHAEKLTEPTGTFLFTGTWYLSGQVAFADRREAIPVLCYNQREPHNFAYWDRPADLLGRTGILISPENARHEPDSFVRFFERIDPPIACDVTRHGITLRRIRLFRCVGQRIPFPFQPPPGGYAARVK